tara:strand:+ start:1899 stop:2669 length:771 start_codon:yes stop_codon:yes gene_type:complete
MFFAIFVSSTLQICDIPVKGFKAQTIFNHDIVVYKSGDIVSSAIRKRRSWEMDVYQNLLPYMSKDTVFIDIGANIGWHSLFMASKQYTVVAFEPFIQNVKLFNASLCINPDLRQRITLYNFGLSSKQLNCDLHQIPEINYGDTHTACDEETKQNWIKHRYIKLGSMKTYRLDDVGRHLFPTKKVVKIDVEGHEYDVLLGATLFFTTNNPPDALFVETFQLGKNKEAFFSLLKSWGYVVKFTDATNTLFIRHSENYA